MANFLGQQNGSGKIKNIIMSKKQFKKVKEKRVKKEQGGMYNSLMTLLEEMSGKAYSVQQLVRKLGLKKKSLIEDLYKILDSLQEEGQVEQLDSGQYKSSRTSKTVTGIVDHVNPRFAYVVTGEAGKKDIYIRTQDLASALHGDTVAVTLSGRKTGESPEGKVVELVKRSRIRFVGKLELSRNFGFVVPDFKKVYQDFFVFTENLNGAKTNDKVLFEVTKWADGDKSPEAKVIEVLGKSGENEAEIHSIMAEFDLPFRFPENVLTESEKISEDISKEEIRKRKDFRDVFLMGSRPSRINDLIAVGAV